MAKTDDRTNETRSIVSVNISKADKDALDRRYGAYVAKYGKDINLMEFTAIQFKQGLAMDIEEIHAIHKAFNESAKTD